MKARNTISLTILLALVAPACGDNAREMPTAEDEAEATSDAGTSGMPTTDETEQTVDAGSKLSPTVPANGWPWGELDETPDDEGLDVQLAGTCIHTPNWDKQVTLAFTSDGQYEAKITDDKGDVVTVAGSYELENQARLFLVADGVKQGRCTLGRLAAGLRVRCILDGDAFAACRVFDVTREQEEAP